MAKLKFIFANSVYHCVIVLIFTNLQLLSYGQNSYRIEGSAFDAETGNQLVNVLVVNKSNGNGTFGDRNGNFIMEVGKTDSIVVSAFGYSSLIFTLKDSVEKPTYKIKAPLKKPLVILRPVTIIAEREIEDIEKDIRNLGYNERDYVLSGIDALNSPITFLYQQFSKREKSKRKLAQLINEDKKRDLLKELLHKYVDYEIIALDDSGFDEFIDYCNVSESFMKSSSQYEFLMYVKYQYKNWEDQPRKLDTLPTIDFDKY